MTFVAVLDRRLRPRADAPRPHARTRDGDAADGSTAHFALLAVGLYLLGVGLFGELLPPLRPEPERRDDGDRRLPADDDPRGLRLVARRARPAPRLRRPQLPRSRYDYRTKWLEVTETFGSPRPRTRSSTACSTCWRVSAPAAIGLAALRRRRPLPPGALGERGASAAARNPEHPLVRAVASRWSSKGSPERSLLRGDARRARRAAARRRRSASWASWPSARRRRGPGTTSTTATSCARSRTRTACLPPRPSSPRASGLAEVPTRSTASPRSTSTTSRTSRRVSRCVAQNAAKHGEDPEFRAQAMKTVERTAEQISELIGQLSRRSPRSRPRGRGRRGGPRRGNDRVARSRVRGAARAWRRHGAHRAGGAGAAPAGGPQPAAEREAGERAGGVGRDDAGRGRGGRARGQPAAARGHGSRAGDPAGAAAEPVPGKQFQSTTPGGFGIGLYESRRIVESYRGTLRVESEPGQGARVVVELPAGTTAVGTLPATSKETEP